MRDVFNIFVLCGYFKQNELLLYALSDDKFPQTSFTLIHPFIE